MREPHLWYCLDCKMNRDIDVHGRCEKCQSDAISHAHREVKLSPEKPESFSSLYVIWLLLTHVLLAHGVLRIDILSNVELKSEEVLQ
jgi:hypothetical protein